MVLQTFVLFSLAFSNRCLYNTNMTTAIVNENYTTQEKLQILADAAKYDVACTSSGSSRRGKKGELGNAEACGICHSFAADGRCISLLKILMTNHCAYDCKYCINRSGNDVKRATFTPQEICELTVEFYKRNYIEGLFLSSGVLRNPTYTMEKMCETLLLLRTKYHFNGYIHVKTIPGASDELLAAAGYLADRISVNLELPTEDALRSLAPNKTMQNILNPMGKVQSTIASHRMAIGKSAYMERSRGNQFLNHSIFSDNSKNKFKEKLNAQNTDARLHGSFHSEKNLQKDVYKRQTINNVGCDGKDRSSRFGITIGMDVFQFLKECRKQCCCDLICSVIIVTIALSLIHIYNSCSCICRFHCRNEHLEEDPYFAQSINTSCFDNIYRE